ncbi:MAG: glycosyltransferase family 4 protein [Candidatus Kapaibacteriota bacterium]
MNAPHPSKHQHIAHFCGTIERNKDGVTRVLSKIHDYNAEQAIAALFITASAGENSEMPHITVSGIHIPHYDGYKLSITPARVIHREIRQEHFQPSLVHLHSPCTLGRAGQKISKWLGVPCVATYHTHFPSYLKYYRASYLEPPLRTFLQRFYNRCHATIVPSQSLSRELQGCGIENIHYLPHGVDNNSFHPSFRSLAWRDAVLGANSDKKIILYVGRLVWEKNLKLFAELVSDISDERTDTQVVIVGIGPAENELRAMMPNAIFLGLKSGRDLSEIYASSDIFLFPSDTETFGNVTLEALASGLPCVVADAGGSSDLVRHGATGFVIRSQQHNDWKAALIMLLDDAPKRKAIANAAFEQAQHYRWESILAQMQTLYTGVQEEYQRRHTQTCHLVLISPPLAVYPPAISSASSYSA